MISKAESGSRGGPSLHYGVAAALICAALLFVSGFVGAESYTLNYEKTQEYPWADKGYRLSIEDRTYQTPFLEGHAAVAAIFAAIAAFFSLSMGGILAVVRPTKQGVLWSLAVALAGGVIAGPVLARAPGSLGSFGPAFALVAVASLSAFHLSSKDYVPPALPLMVGLSATTAAVVGYAGFVTGEWIAATLTAPSETVYESVTWGGYLGSTVVAALSYWAGGIAAKHYDSRSHQHPYEDALRFTSRTKKWETAALTGLMAGLLLAFNMAGNIGIVQFGDGFLNIAFLVFIAGGLIIGIMAVYGSVRGRGADQAVHLVRTGGSYALCAGIAALLLITPLAASLLLGAIAFLIVSLFTFAAFVAGQEWSTTKDNRPPTPLLTLGAVLVALLLTSGSVVGYYAARVEFLSDRSHAHDWVGAALGLLMYSIVMVVAIQSARRGDDRLDMSTSGGK